MTKTLFKAAIGIAIFAGATALSTPASAQFGSLKDKLKKKAERTVEKTAEDEIDKAVNDALNGTPSPTSAPANASNTPTSTASTSVSGTAKPISITQCDTLRPTNVRVGQLGSYSFQQGMSREERTGFINRRDVSFESGCVLPNMQSGDVLYMEFDTTALKAKGHSNAYETQCIKIDDQASGAINTREGRSEYPSNDSYLGDSHLRLACGNSEGISECTTGSNSDRASAASSDLKARNKTALSFLMTSTRRPDMLGPQERLYCQYYNKESGKSLFAYEYLRVRG